MALNPKKNKNTSLATNASSGYNKIKETSGSYKGAETGFKTTSNYVPGSVTKKETKPSSSFDSYTGIKTDFKTSFDYLSKPKAEFKSNVPKTPKVSMANYRETTSNINAPLPRATKESGVDAWIKKTSEKTGISLQNTKNERYGFTAENAKAKTSPMYKKQEPKLKLNLPNTLERDFAKGIFGDKKEAEIYNSGVLEEAAKAGFLKDTRTQDDLFRTGFHDLPDIPKYAFTEKADDKVKYDLFNLLDFGKTPPSKVDTVKDIWQKSKNKPPELDPNVKIMPTPKADFTKEWHAAKPAESALKWEAANPNIDVDESVSAHRAMLDTADRLKTAYDYAKIHKDFIEDVKTANSATTVRNAQRATGNLRLSSTVKTSGKGIGISAKIVNGAIEFFRYDEDKREYISQGMDIEEARGRSAYNTAGRVGFSAAISVGLPATCKFIGSFFGPLGTVIGGFIGHLGAWALTTAFADDVGDFVEAEKYDKPQDPRMIYS